MDPLVAARIKFEYFKRDGTPKGKRFELKADEYVATSAEGQWYELPSIVLPQPGLKIKLDSGESSEGGGPLRCRQMIKSRSCSLAAAIYGFNFSSDHRK